ncbi:MAG: hypothetical protein HKP31_01265 [Nitrosopumilus sp.]|nr:hypothetical protein [Nitrosopumilus sp.]
MKTSYKILIIIAMVFTILFVPPNIAAFSCNTLEIKGIHCHVMGMAFFGMQFKTNIYEWYGWTDTYPCGGVLAHPDRGYNCMGIEDYWGLPPEFSSNAEREIYEPIPGPAGIGDWSGTAEGITDEQTGLTCIGKGTMVIDGQCILPETQERVIDKEWTAEYDETTPTVLILLGAVLEENESLDPKIIAVVLNKNNTVLWTNGDDVPHTFVGDTGDEMWSTGMIKPGESSSVTFNRTGVFEYHGTPGPWITGKVIVLEK